MRTSLAMLILSLVLIGQGCQSSPGGPPVDSSSVGMPDSHGDDPYTRANLNDDDEAPPRNIGLRAMDATGAFFSKIFTGISEPIVKLYKRLNGEKPSTFARLMEDPNSPDHRREGINGLLQYDFSKVEPYTRRYRQIAVNDPDAIARATAVRAANRCRDPRATPVFVRSLTDKSELVRLEGAKGLVHQPDPAAVSGLLTIAANREEDRDVRIAAVDALKHYRQPPVARALVASLNDRDFGIAWQSRRSLRYLTARDFRYDDGAWLAYFTGPDKPF